MIRLIGKRSLSRTLTVLLVGVIAVSSAACGTAAATTTAAVKTEAATDAVTESAAVELEADTPAAVLDSLEDDDKLLSLEGYGAQGALADENLTVADMLTYAIQDEYLAHDEYAAIIETFGKANPYANIIESEEMHISYLDDLFTSYEMPLPTPDSIGHLVIPDSLLTAAKTGVQAEIDNIAMYEKFLGEALPLDVMDVFSALKTASESHLSAFEKQVEKLS